MMGAKARGYERPSDDCNTMMMVVYRAVRVGLGYARCGVCVSKESKIPYRTGTVSKKDPIQDRNTKAVTGLMDVCFIFTRDSRIHSSWHTEDLFCVPLYHSLGTSTFDLLR